MLCDEKDCVKDKCWGWEDCKKKPERVSGTPEFDGSVSTPQDDFNAMADLWISRGLDHTTFLMCYIAISDCIKEKQNAHFEPRY